MICKNNCLKCKKNQEWMKQYNAFINEKETIRKRAIVKYQSELKTRLQKMVEHDILVEELKEIKLK